MLAGWPAFGLCERLPGPLVSGIQYGRQVGGFFTPSRVDEVSS
ncbi:hypothetical protein TSMEX_002308 [Taenia solium]|eukprot:TsM_000143700 transcript=TsM_000143700 gene=TsM_000143700